MTPDCLSHQVRLRQELLNEDSGGAKGGAGGAGDSSPLPPPPPPRADASAHHDAIAQHDAIHPVLGWSQPTSTGSALLAATPSATATTSATTSAAAGGGAAASLSQALGFLQEVRHLCMRPVARACKCSPRRSLIPTGDFACVVWRCAPELCWLVRADGMLIGG